VAIFELERIVRDYFAPPWASIAATIGETGVTLWNVQSGKQIHTFTGHLGKVRDLAFSPDGKGIITASEDMTAILWDAQSGQMSFKMNFSAKKGSYNLRNDAGPVWHVGFSPDGKRIITGHNKEARLWDAETGAEFTSLKNGQRTTASAFSPDGKQVITVGPENTAIVWDAATGHEVFTLGGHLNVSSLRSSISRTPKHSPYSRSRPTLISAKNSGLREGEFWPDWENWR
jgi:WD40 repeat protein